MRVISDACWICKNLDKEARGKDTPLCSLVIAFPDEELETEGVCSDFEDEETEEVRETLNESSWVCDKCGSTAVFWNGDVNELVCKKCGKIFRDAMPKLAVLSKDRISERGICQACGLENAHLIAKCQNCGKKLCAEMCFEDLELNGCLCLCCRTPIV